MNNIEIIFRKSILQVELIPFIFVIVSVILMIILTIYLVKKELKEGSKNEK